MSTKKLTLEDLKLESFLTEIDETKLVKMQGGNGSYGEFTTTNDATTTDDEITMGINCPETATDCGCDTGDDEITMGINCPETATDCGCDTGDVTYCC